MEEQNDIETTGEMHHREITLSDGRYMIFYTFGDENIAEDKPDRTREDV